MKWERVYPRMPIPLQNVACSLYGLRAKRERLGPSFWRFYDWLQETESWSPARIEAYQDEQVAELIREAYETVPYYRRVMEERGLRPGDVTSRQDLAKLPVLRKEDVIAHGSQLRSTRAQRGARQGRTSGTTGKALSFTTTRDAIAFQWAVWWRHRRRFGCTPGQWHLSFTGKPVVPGDQKRPPYWRVNTPLRQVVVNMQHILPGKVGSIAAAVGRQELAFYAGYPSIVHSFCELLRSSGLQLERRPACVFLGAENVLAFQRATIEEVTGAVVTDQYGFAEGAGNASRCVRDVYHEDWEFGVLECADPVPLEDGGYRGPILATGFSNRAFPFIRYEVGDVGAWAPGSYRCGCGLHSRVLRHIEGRREDFVLTPEGARIMRFDYVFKDAHGVAEAQVVQRELGAVVIRLVPRSTFAARDEHAIRQKVHDLISPRLRVDFEHVDEIPRGASGKFRPVLSELGRANP